MGVLKAFSSEVHAVNSNGNYFDASKSTLNKMNIYKTLIAINVNAKQGGSSFSANKNSTKKDSDSKHSSNDVHADKCKDGSSFNASNFSEEQKGNSQSSSSTLLMSMMAMEIISMQAKAPVKVLTMAPQKIMMEVNLIQLITPLNKMHIFKTLQSMLTPKKGGSSFNASKAPINKMHKLKSLQAVLMPQKVNIKYKSKFDASKNFSESDLYNSNQLDKTFENSISASKNKSGNKFDVTKTSTENGLSNNSDRASVEARNKNGHFSTSKNTFLKKIKPLKTVLAPQNDKNGNKFDKSIIPMNTISRVKALQAMFIPQIIMEIISMQIISLLKSSKDKDRRNFILVNDTVDVTSHAQDSSNEVHAGDSHGNYSMQVKLPLNEMDILKPIYTMLKTLTLAILYKILI
ncbi:hypothetical protein F8M41_017855 [Gigaspora margarita]|uniref:Uncharacterized protein n=1 Tax=Gigaspora margarita TaxID=4874 RepID=A0A8H4ELN5_GIGMA|nr:hypothetical protein F8M41_017855 [Gigaspora margarita]